MVTGKTQGEKIGTVGNLKQGLGVGKVALHSCYTCIQGTKSPPVVTCLQSKLLKETRERGGLGVTTSKRKGKVHQLKRGNCRGWECFWCWVPVNGSVAVQSSTEEAQVTLVEPLNLQQQEPGFCKRRTESIGIHPYRFACFSIKKLAQLLSIPKGLDSPWLSLS